MLGDTTVPTSRGRAWIAGATVPWKSVFVLDGRSAEAMLSDCVFETREFETGFTSCFRVGDLDTGIV